MNIRAEFFYILSLHVFMLDLLPVHEKKNKNLKFKVHLHNIKMWDIFFFSIPLLFFPLLVLMCWKILFVYCRKYKQIYILYFFKGSAEPAARALCILFFCEIMKEWTKMRWNRIEIKNKRRRGDNEMYFSQSISIIMCA